MIKNTFYVAGEYILIRFFPAWIRPWLLNSKVSLFGAGPQLQGNSVLHLASTAICNLNPRGQRNHHRREKDFPNQITGD